MKNSVQQASDYLRAHDDAEWRRSFRRKLMRWYDQAARDLPWRRNEDPYAVWISEIMLQQTQVETVQPYFHRFLKRFPTIAALASAAEAEVLRLWEGLGYYRRARQLHSAARQIVSQHQGKFPDNFTDVVTLPGIGRYTAGAILSISFGQRMPILEANTYRLLARLAAYRDDPMKAAGQKALWEMAETILPRSDCGRFNQALMELGSLICTPREPDCPGCPVAELCPTNQLGLQSEIPPTKQKKPYEKVIEVALVVRRGRKVVLRECAVGERWAGLWDFPRYAITAEQLVRSYPQLTELTRQQTGLDIRIDDQLTTIKHGVTKYRITLHCLRATALPGTRLSKPAKWVAVKELETYPLSVTGRKISRLIQQQDV